MSRESSPLFLSEDDQRAVEYLRESLLNAPEEIRVEHAIRAFLFWACKLSFQYGIVASFPASLSLKNYTPKLPDVAADLDATACATHLNKVIDDAKWRNKDHEKIPYDPSVPAKEIGEFFRDLYRQVMSKEPPEGWPLTKQEDQK